MYVACEAQLPAGSCAVISLYLSCYVPRRADNKMIVSHGVHPKTTTLHDAQHEDGQMRRALKQLKRAGQDGEAFQDVAHVQPVPSAPEVPLFDLVRIATLQSSSCCSMLCNRLVMHMP